MGIFGQLPFLSTDGEVINKGGRSDEKAQEENIKEGEGAKRGDDKIDLSAESQNTEEENGYRLKQRDGVDQYDKEKRTTPNDTPLLNIKHQCPSMEDEEPRVHNPEGAKDCFLKLAKEPDGIPHLSSSLGESGKNSEVSINFENDVNEGVENRKQGEELEITTVAKLSGKTENTFDVSIQSQHNILTQPDPGSLENENEEKKQAVLSTLEVPSIHSDPVLKRKGLPSAPDKGIITTKKENTEEVKIVIQPEDEHHIGDDNGNDDDDEDGVVSAEDLLCFSWQIAQGMVSSQPKDGKF